MASRSSYRPRRTHIYGTNYDIGESYYKKQLDNLDNKRRLNSFSTINNTDHIPREEKLLPKVSFSIENEDAPPKLSFQREFECDEIFKPTPRRIYNTRALLDDFDEEASNLRIKSSVSKYDTVEHSKHDGILKKDPFKRGYDSFKESSPFLDNLEHQVQDDFSIRRLRARSENVFLENKEANDASSRMKATKARLADLESEMLSLAEKQSNREKRNKNLKALLIGKESEN